MSTSHRLLALDLDGTLISLDLKVDDRDAEALTRARAAGMQDRKSVV